MLGGEVYLERMALPQAGHCIMISDGENAVVVKRLPSLQLCRWPQAFGEAGLPYHALNLPKLIALGSRNWIVISEGENICGKSGDT